MIFIIIVELKLRLASLLQVRFSELPSTISAEGQTDTEGSLGASGEGKRSCEITAGE